MNPWDSCPPGVAAEGLAEHTSSIISPCIKVCAWSTESLMTDSTDFHEYSLTTVASTELICKGSTEIISIKLRQDE